MHFGSIHISGNYKQATHSFSQTHPLGEQLVTRQQIQFPDKFTGIEIYLLVSFLELVQFFQYDKGKMNIIFLKILQAIVVVKNNICV